MGKSVKVVLAVAALLSTVAYISSDELESLHWNYISEGNSTVNYRIFLSIWPDGKNAAEAKTAHEDLAWKNAKELDTVGALKIYLYTFAEGRYREEAQNLIDEKLWISAKADASVEALQEYLSESPDGRYRKDAKNGIQEAFNADPEVKSIESEISQRYCRKCGSEELVEELARYGDAAEDWSLQNLGDIANGSTGSLVGCDLFSAILGRTRSVPAIDVMTQITNKYIELSIEADARYAERATAYSVRGSEPMVERWRDCADPAAQALGKIGDPLAIEALSKMVRVLGSRSAALALAEIGDERGIESLVYGLHHWRYMPNDVSKALLKFGNDAVAGAKTVLKSDADANIKAATLFFLRHEALLRDTDVVSSLLSDDEPKVRVEAIKVIAQLDKPESGELIAPLLGDSDLEVRYIAADSLITLGKKSSTAVLAPILEEKYRHPSTTVFVKEEIIENLGLFGNDKSLDVLVEALEIRRLKKADSSMYWPTQKLNRLAAISLGQLGEVAATEPLVNSLVNWRIRKDVANSLSRLGWQPRDDVEKVRWAVSRGRKSSLLENWAETKTILLRDVVSDDYQTIEFGLYAFIGLGREEILPELVAKLEKNERIIMAEAYLNCGNTQLYEAAEKWARERGYKIQRGQGSAPVGWGRL